MDSSIGFGNATNLALLCATLIWSFLNNDILPVQKEVLVTVFFDGTGCSFRCLSH